MDLFRGLSRLLLHQLSGLTSETQFTILFLILFLLALPIGLLMRKIGRGRSALSQPATLQDQLQQSLNPQPGQPAQSQDLSSQLALVRSGLFTFYKIVLFVIFLVGTGFTIFLFRVFSKDANRDFLQFYFAIGYLLFVAWIVGQWWKWRGGRTYWPANPNWSIRVVQADPKVVQVPDLRAAGGPGQPSTRTFQVQFNIGSPPAGTLPQQDVPTGAPANQLPAQTQQPLRASLNAGAIIAVIILSTLFLAALSTFLLWKRMPH
jgi:hypothetical protein